LAEADGDRAHGGTAPFAALAWTSIVPLLLMVEALAITAALLAELDATGRLLLAAVVVERLLGATGTVAALRSLGLGRPDWRALLVAACLAALIQGVYPLVAGVTGAAFTLRPGWPWLLLGIAAFDGVAGAPYGMFAEEMDPFDGSAVTVVRGT
jgi:hypothetical protein